MSKNQPKTTARERIARAADKLLDPQGVRQQELEKALEQWQDETK